MYNNSFDKLWNINFTSGNIIEPSKMAMYLLTKTTLDALELT